MHLSGRRAGEFPCVAQREIIARRDLFHVSRKTSQAKEKHTEITEAPK